MKDFREKTPGKRKACGWDENRKFDAPALLFIRIYWKAEEFFLLLLLIEN